MATITTEKRKRGFFGWIFLLLFWGWQLLMGASLFKGMADASNQLQYATSEAARAGATIGIGMGVTMVLVVWALGTAILGAMVLMTRGKKILITKEVT